MGQLHRPRYLPRWRYPQAIRTCSGRKFKMSYRERNGERSRRTNFDSGCGGELTLGYPLLFLRGFSCTSIPLPIESSLLVHKGFNSYLPKLASLEHG